MIKAAFFDLDGTVLDPSTHDIPLSNKQALADLQSKGIKIFISSGRSYNMLHTMNGVLDISWDGYICNNGTLIHDKDGKLIASSFFTTSQVEALIEKARNEHLTLTLRTLNESIAPLGVDQNMIIAHDFFNEPLARYIRDYNNEQVFMALLYANMDYDFHSVEQIEGLAAFPNRSTYADICIKGISKASGIEQIMKLYHYQKDELIAFGDECNDLEMLSFVPLSIAMGNANIKVKEICSYTTDTVDNEGIRKALVHFHIL